MRGKSRWGFLDQAFSSASNAFLLIALARSLPVEGFGQISALFIILLSLLGFTRGIIGAHLAVASNDVRRLQVERSFGLALSCVVGLSVTLLGMGMCILNGPPATVWLAALSPSVIVPQDTLRYAAVARGAPKAAAVSDGLWLVGSAALLTTTFNSSSAQPALLIAIWLASALVALVAILLIEPVRPRFQGIVAWFRADIIRRSSFGVEGVASSLNSSLIVVIVTSSMGFAATAALRGAGTIMGPLSLLMAALPLVIVPELVRNGVGRNGRQLWKRLRLIATGISLLAICVGSLGLWLPPALGTALLGQTWPSASRILPVMGLEYIFLAWMHAAGSGLRALGAGTRLLTIRLAFFGSAILAVSLASRTSDVMNVAVALSGVAAIYSIVTVLALVRSRPARVLQPADW